MHEADIAVATVAYHLFHYNVLKFLKNAMMHVSKTFYILRNVNITNVKYVYRNTYLAKDEFK